MSSSSGVEAGAAVGVGDAVSSELAAVLARLTELADLPTDPASDGGVELVDRIAVLEQIRAALAAAQHTAMVAFGRSQVEEQAELVASGRLDPEKLGRGSPTRSASPRTSPPGRAPGG